MGQYAAIKKKMNENTNVGHSNLKILLSENTKQDAEHGI